MAFSVAVRCSTFSSISAYACCCMRSACLTAVTSCTMQCVRSKRPAASWAILPSIEQTICVPSLRTMSNSTPCVSPPP